MTKSIGSQIERISWHCALLFAVLVPHAAWPIPGNCKPGPKTPTVEDRR